MLKNIKKDLVRAVKILIIVSIIGVGTVYALNYTDPLTSPPTCPDGNTGCSAPLNVGSSTQIKTGQLDIQGGLLVEGVSVFSPNNVEIGDDSNFPTLQIFGLNKTPNNPTATYPAPLCADSDGYLTLCPGPGAASVDLTVDTPTITTSEVTSITQGVNLTWTTTNMVGGTCVGTQNNGATGFTGTPSYAGGTDAATVEKFGTTTFTITCTPTVGAPVTDTATVDITGYKTYTTSGSFITSSFADLSSISTFTIKAVGGGGGGGYGGYDPGPGQCNGGPDEGTAGTDTIVNVGTQIEKAQAGGGAGFSSNGTPGNGYTQTGVTVNAGSGVNPGITLTVGATTYGKGGVKTGPCSYGYSGAGSAGVTTTYGPATFTYTIGAAGTSDVAPGNDGTPGAVRFSW